jgi:hypothetical protein
MINKYLAAQNTGFQINLLIDGKEFLADDQPSFWRVGAGFELDGNPINEGVILCLKCNEIVDLRLETLVLYCKCAECSTYSIDDTLSDNGAS